MDAEPTAKPPTTSEVDFTFVQTSHRLVEVIAQLLPEVPLAVDTEADSMHVYREKLCLIQLSDGASHFLIDPLAPGMDLAPLYAEMERREVIFHDCDYDLRLFKRLAPFQPGGVFDTMIAARLLGYPQFGLGAVVERHFGIVLEKANQKADWGQRPLSETMMRYAVGDVLYLPEIRRAMKAELERLGRADWYAQSLGQMLAGLDEEREPKEPGWWKLAAQGRFRGRGVAVLRELWNWREKIAEGLDRPTFRVVRNQDLLAVVQDLEATGGERPRVPFRQAQWRGGFLAAIERALAMPEDEWPVRELVRRGRRLTEEEEAEIDVFKAKRDKVAADLKIDPSLIASHTKIQAIVTDPSKTVETLLPWQRSLLEL